LLVDDGSGAVQDPDTNGDNYNFFYEEIDNLLKLKRDLTVWRNYIIPEKVDVSCRVRYKKEDNYFYSDVESDITVALQTYFNYEVGSLGSDVLNSDIVRIVEAVPGVDYCFVDLKNDKVNEVKYIKYGTFTSGTYAITNIDTTNLEIGMSVTGLGIPEGAYIATIPTSTTVNINTDLALTQTLSNTTLNFISYEYSDTYGRKNIVIEENQYPHLFNNVIDYVREV